MVVVCLLTWSPFTAYQRRLVIPTKPRCMGREGMKTLVIASCESCPTRRRRCYFIPGMVLGQCATSQDTSENSTTYQVVRAVCISSSYCTIHLICRAEDVHIIYSGVYRTLIYDCLLYTSPSPRDGLLARMPSSA